MRLGPGAFAATCRAIQTSLTHATGMPRRSEAGANLSFIQE